MTANGLTSLSPSDFRTLLPLYDRAPATFALIRAVMEGVQPGTAHCDRPEAPSLAFVTNRFGFAQLFGAAEGDRVAETVMAALSGDPALKGRYLLWYDPPEACRVRMDERPGSRARTRIAYRFDPERFAALDPAVHAPPPEATVRLVDAETLAEAEVFGLDLGGRFWPSADAFLKDGIGVLVEVGGEAACLCYSACVAGGVAEVDVVTQEAFKGRGLARSAAAAFIRECLARGVTPNWDCFDYNEPSVRLAVSLGFEEVRRYPFYSINT